MDKYKVLASFHLMADSTSGKVEYLVPLVMGSFLLGPVKARLGEITGEDIRNISVRRIEVLEMVPDLG